MENLLEETKLILKNSAFILLIIFYINKNLKSKYSILLVS